MKKINVLILIILPAVLVITVSLLKYSRGSYWLVHNSDPAYVYLLNSLALAESQKASTTGHPGTTLQIVGAAIMKIVYAFDSSKEESLKNKVLKNPELFLNITFIFLLTCNALLLFIIGLTTFNLTKNIWMGILLQFSPFISTVMLNLGLIWISPEPLLIFSSLLFVLILVKFVFNKNYSKSVRWYMTSFALVSGFGIATKMTFLPLLMIPLFILPKLRNKIVFIFLTGLSFVIWTWPIISQYEILLKWYWRILAHTGYYGLGQQGIIDSGIFSHNISQLFLGNPLFFLVWFLALIFMLIVGLLRRNTFFEKKIWDNISFKVLAVLVFVQLCSVLIFSKGGYDYYFLPMMNLSVLMLFLMIVYLQGIGVKVLSSAGTVWIICIFLLLSSVWRAAEIMDVFIKNLQNKREGLAIFQTLENDYKDYSIISCYRCSSPICALSFGNFFINNGVYSEALQNIYGEAYFYDRREGKFHTWTKEYAVEDIIFHNYNNRILIHAPFFVKEHGFKLPTKTGSVLHLKDIFDGEFESIYMIRGMTLGAGKFQPFSLSPESK